MAEALLVYQGASLHVVFDVTDEAGVPFPLTANGYTAAAMQVRPRPGSDSVLLDLSTAAGTLTIEPGGVTGEVHADVGADLTLTAGSGAYDCLAWNPSDTTNVLVIASGQVRLTKRVTAKP